MKGISLKQPFANLIMDGHKTIETRSSNSGVAKTLHRGVVGICTSKSVHDIWNNIVHGFKVDPYFINAVNKGYGFNAEYDKICMPHSSELIGIAEIVDIRPMTEADQKQACYSIFPGAMAIVLANIQRCKPIPLKGLTNGFHLGVFNINLDDTIIEFLEA